MRKGERRKSRKDRKSVLGTALAGTLLLGAFAGLCGCGGAQNGSGADAGSLFGQTDGTEAAEAAWNEEDGTPVAYLGGETVYLEEALFYTRMLQEQWEQAYYQDFGSGMWQQEAADDGRTLEDVLKGDVMSLLAELHLLCAHAEEYGAQLTEEDQEGIAQRAQRFMESNTPEVLEAAGATEESVAHYLTRNELAARTAQRIQEAYEPELDEDAARVGRLTYCLFSVRGTYDLEGNHTPFTEEEIAEIGREAQEFAVRAQELGDIAAAGEEAAHTSIDAYFNDHTDGGVHPDVADAVRAMEAGQVSDPIETEDGWYVVQRVSDYDEDATADNLEAMTLQAKEDYLLELEAQWQEETPLVIEEEVWDAVRVDEMLTEA